jgi:hypothetical protein
MFHARRSLITYHIPTDELPRPIYSHRDVDLQLQPVLTLLELDTPDYGDQISTGSVPVRPSRSYIKSLGKASLGKSNPA